MDITEYLLIFLNKIQDQENLIPIPSVRFWAITLLVISTRIEIKIKDHVLTPQDCFIEMNDCANGDCYKKH